MIDKDYIVIVQCHIVKERCSGYACEYAFSQRSGGFSEYSKEQELRILTMTCGGCCGRAVHRKMRHLIKKIKQTENIGKERIVVHLSSCIVNDSCHSTPCPHVDYLKEIIRNKLGLDLRESTKISELAQQRRNKGTYCTD